MQRQKPLKQPEPPMQQVPPMQQAPLSITVRGAPIAWASVPASRLPKGAMPTKATV